MTWCIWPPNQNFTGAFCHVTPVLNDILDLCRYHLTYLNPPPKFHRCILSRYTCVKWYFRSMQIWLDVFDPRTKILWMHFITLHTAVQPISIQPLQTQQKPRVTEAQHNAEKHFLFWQRSDHFWHRKPHLISWRHLFRQNYCRDVLLKKYQTFFRRSFRRYWFVHTSVHHGGDCVHYFRNPVSAHAQVSPLGGAAEEPTEGVLRLWGGGDRSHHVTGNRSGVHVSAL